MQALIIIIISSGQITQIGFNFCQLKSGSNFFLRFPGRLQDLEEAILSLLVEALSDIILTFCQKLVKTGLKFDSARTILGKKLTV